MKSKIEVIFWDFDGVLMNSNAVRDHGFEQVLREYPKQSIEKLLEFHRENGGLSRYVKFRYFFEEIMSTSISDDEIQEWANKFSEIMRKLLLNKDLLIQESLDFIRKNQENYRMHVTSGSDQEELRFLCQSLQIDNLFTSIHGSPKPKKEWVRDLINKHNYNNEYCVLVGDSFNDYEAARVNNIAFQPYNYSGDISFEVSKCLDI